ncbi:MAG: hypothetical protein ACLUMQ_07135 [Streptococcus salivarius]
MKTLQSGREAEVLQKEEEQRQRVAEAKERLASYAPTRQFSKPFSKCCECNYSGYSSVQQ